MAASETRIDDDGFQGPPPTYDEIDDTTKQSTAALLNQPVPGPAENGKFFGDEPGKPLITLTLMAEPGKDPKHQPWFGEIKIKCHDVPRLMREGFRWTTANVIREEGCIEKIAPELAGLGNPHHPCTVTRNWFLRDLQQPSRWTTCLQVHAPHAGVASKIRLDDWTPDMVQIGIAAGLSEKVIYYYDATRPEYAYNAIYDDMPLEEWWPWPKKDNETAKE